MIAEHVSVQVNKLDDLHALVGCIIMGIYTSNDRHVVSLDLRDLDEPEHLEFLNSLTAIRLNGKKTIYSLKPDEQE